MPSTPLHLAHGFTQTGRSWARIQALLADAGFGSTATDLPGHGAATDVVVDLWGCADHLVAATGPGTFVGYSMGGRVCLHAALAHPAVVKRLVLIGATAGLVDPVERTTRRSADNDLAARILEVGVPTFIDTWLTNPLFAGLTSETALREDRLRNTAAGLASSLRHAGTGTQEPLWDRLSNIDLPVLLLAGERDPKFRALAERMSEALPHATTRVIENAGHSVHLEEPDATVDAIVGWLS